LVSITKFKPNKKDTSHATYLAVSVPFCHFPSSYLQIIVEEILATAANKLFADK